MTTAQAVAVIERIIVAAGQSDFSAQTIANARAGLDALLSELQTMRQFKEHESERAQNLLHHGVTLATVCDMVLGADANDRSGDALVRAVGEMKREREESIDALREMIGQMEHEADTQHAAALDLQAQRDAATNRAEQAEADAHLLAFGVQTGQRIEGLFEVASKYYVSPPPAQEYKKPRGSERA